MGIHVGRQIKSIRDKRNLSQERFGKKLGLSGKTISAYETSKATPPLYVLERVSEVYEVNIFDIPPSQKQDISKRMNNISNAVKELQNILETGLSL